MLRENVKDFSASLPAAVRANRACDTRITAVRYMTQFVVFTARSYLDSMRAVWARYCLICSAWLTACPWKSVAWMLH